MSLRHSTIDYTRGWFFVTTQVAHNKTIFGVISNDRCELNELGRRVAYRWQDLFNHRSELQGDAFVVMPNHFHALLKMNPRSDGRTIDLSRVMQIFKSIAANEYLALLRQGQCPDIGAHLWQRSFYDRRIRNPRQLEATRAYIRNNPARWAQDRFGPVTAYHYGNLELLQQPLIAYVASNPAGGASPRCTGGASSYCTGGASPPPLAGRDEALPLPQLWASASPLISTFISRPERAVLAQCLARQHPYVQVLPAGIPEPLPAAWLAACQAGRALLLSPAPPGTILNKQRAIWCNQYVLGQATEVHCGYIQPGGTLETLLHTCSRKIAPSCAGGASPYAGGAS